MSDHAAARTADTYVVPVSINRLHGALVLAYGLVTPGLGIALVVWPKASVTDISLHVLVVFGGIWLILAGLLATVATFRLRSEPTTAAW
jgi:uncharacterized membrane protein HdeD (DUF308 family)